MANLPCFIYNTLNMLLLIFNRLILSKHGLEFLLLGLYRILSQLRLYLISVLRGLILLCLEVFASVIFILFYG